MNNQNTQAKYHTVRKVTKVRVKVPSARCEYMSLIPEHSFNTRGATEVDLMEHYKHGMPVGGVIVNRHFYGLTPEDLGRKINATVEVVIKTTGDGKKYTMINITKDREIGPASHLMDFGKNKSEGDGGIYVTGSGGFYLHFLPLQAKGNPATEAEMPTAEEIANPLAE